MRIARRARTEVDRGDTARGEVRDVGPRLLRLDGEAARRPERLDERRVDHDVRRRRVADDVQRRLGRQECPEVRLGLLRAAVGRVPHVERRGRARRNHVVGGAGLEPRHRDDLEEREAVDHGLAPLVPGDRGQPLDCGVESVRREPRSCRVAAEAGERDARGDVADTPRLNRQVGRLEQDRERGLRDQRAAVEERGQRVVHRRQLFPPEEEERDVDLPRLAGGEFPDELERDGDAAFHVARPAAVHGAVLQAARDVRLRGHGVVMPREDEERGVRTAFACPEERIVALEDGRERQRDERPEPLADLGLVQALGPDVDELERAGREALGEAVHGASVPPYFALMTAGETRPRAEPEPERGLLVAVLPQGVDGEEELDELRELARTAGVNPVAHVVQHRERPDPRSYVGRGKVDELKAAWAEASAEVLLVDDELQPTQQRTLEDALSARVVDRTQLILDIFAQHAVSAEGKLQVELAQLEYNLPRMRGMWKHLERLGGGTGGLGAGVGTRGPGESQLESDRRMAGRRITLLRRRLRDVAAHRETRRKERARAGVPTVALAGYTNVGKSTLLNALTGADVSVENRLFETLDPTTRGFDHLGKRYLVTDTVGFIRRLPTQLVEGFASTLEETLVADVVLHVLDAALPDDRLGEQIAAVDDVLAGIGADELPRELVLNKIDRLDPLARRRLANRYPTALQVSATNGEGIDELKERVAGLFENRYQEVRLLVPYEDGASLSALYALGAPIDERLDTEEGVVIRARLPQRDVRRFARYLVAEASSTRVTRP